MGLNEGDVVDLNIEVEYHGLANVDFEYLVQQSPNSRAMMRDQYRAAIEEDLRLSIEGFVEARHVDQPGFSYPNNPTNPRNLHLLGIRSVEERGEEQWYSQRYMNILTNGAMISEIAIHPFDRYAHCAYPFTTSGSDYPQNPLPLAVWNETSTGRLDPFNPAPFLARGYQSGSNVQHTLGLKYGACGTNQTVAHGYCRNLNLLGSEKDRVVRILTDNYEIGWPPSDYNTNIGDFVGRAKFFSDVVPKIWEARVVAPTPTSLTLELRSFFNSTTVGPYILRIQDVAGKQRMVRTISRSEQLSIDVQDLENGTYMLHVSSGDGFVISKPVVVYR